VFRDLERAVQRLDAEGRRLIVLMDEFEKITGNPNFEQGFFSFLRHLANHYQVAYVTSSEAELMRMCHARVIADSPFFNIFSNLPLGPFTREEARDLVVGASSEAGVSLEPYAEELVRLGGRIPMYLQILCCAYFDEVSSDPTAEVRWVDVRDECMNELRPHFEFVWQRMGEIEKQVLRTLARGGKLPAAQRHHVEELRSRGLVQMEAQQPRVFSEAFAAYVQEQDDTGGGWLKKVFRRGK
jgi:serine/threonine-protein kinase